MSALFGLGLVALVAFLYLALPRREATTRETDEDAGHEGESDGAYFKVVWGVAAHEAAVQSAPAIELEHVLLAATHCSAVADFLEQPVAHVRRHLCDSLAGRAPGEEASDGVTIETMMLLSRTRQLARERGGLTSLGDLFAALRETGGIFPDLIRQRGVQALHVLRPYPVSEDQTSTYVGGDGPYRSSSALVDVVVLDNETTTFDAVIELLREAFDLEATRAAFVAFEAHHCGSGLVARIPREEAESRIRRASERARGASLQLAFRMFEPASTTL